MLLVEVAVDRPLDRTYTYAVPPEFVEGTHIGSRVEIPLGRSETRGVVISLGVTLPDGIQAKPILGLLDPLPLLTPELISVARWVAHHYVGHLGEVLDAMAPGGVRDLRPMPRYHAVGDREDALLRLGNRAASQQQILIHLFDQARGVEREDLRRRFPRMGSPLKALQQRGFVRVTLESRSRPEGMGQPGTEPFPALNESQRVCYLKIAEDLLAIRHRTHLVHGITGCGKTEIYLALIRDTLDQGRGAILLLPEISLTIPVMNLLKARFGSSVALLHSNLAPRERYREWLSIARGERRVVVGARSAIFAPLDRLGLVVIDEEPESSYRQEERPVYHARDVALARARHQEAVVVLGSATPSLESWYRAQQGEFCYHRLKERFNGQPLPEVTLIDMGEEYSRRKNTSVFSMKLKSSLHEVLKGDGQALLFLNRRGHSTYLFCRSCGYVHSCVDCSLTLNYHLDRGEAICHLCGYRTEPPRRCPKCEGLAFRYMGSGTQKVEEAFRTNFPRVVSERMDSDTTSRRGSHARILERYRSGETRVLIGTQMVGKGFNFPNLELVGVVNADVTLNLTDFRGGERTFQMVTQVAGRAGRGTRPGTVLVQTYTRTITASAQREPTIMMPSLTSRSVGEKPCDSRLSCNWSMSLRTGKRKPNWSRF